MSGRSALPPRTRNTSGAEQLPLLARWPVSRRRARRRRLPIPHRISLGRHQPVIFLETWPPGAEPGPSGTGYVRTFTRDQWLEVACIVSRLKAGFHPDAVP